MERKSGETDEQILKRMKVRLAQIENQIKAETLPNPLEETITREREKLCKKLKKAAQERKTFRKNVNANYEESENLRRKREC